MNVGATTPEGYGDYFAWGETAAKATCDWGNYFDTKDGGYEFTKYNNEGGKTVLDLEDDAAHVNLGSRGYYWSSKLYELDPDYSFNSNYACEFCIDSGGRFRSGSFRRYGQSVRPVLP